MLLTAVTSTFTVAPEVNVFRFASASVKRLRYGVKLTDRNMARRVSFLIGLDGKIAHVTDSPSADTHLSEMKEAVAKLDGH